MSRKRKSGRNLEPWLIIFVVVFFLIATMIGIWINRGLSNIERSEMSIAQFT
jgi:hypothetical protein